MRLDVIVSRNTGEIQGDVAPEGMSQDRSTVQVTLMRATDGEEIFEFPKMTKLDQYGHFGFKDLAPGKYRIYFTRALRLRSTGGQILILCKRFCRNAQRSR